MSESKEKDEMASEPSISDCLAHRCSKHYTIPPLNTTVFRGAECGACIREYERELCAQHLERRAMSQFLTEGEQIALRESAMMIRRGKHIEEHALDATANV